MSVLLSYILVDLIKQKWPVTLEQLERVQEFLDISARNHLDAILVVYFFEFTEIIVGLV